MLAIRVPALRSEVLIFLGEDTGAGAVFFLKKAPLMSGGMVAAGRLWGGVCNRPCTLGTCVGVKVILQSLSWGVVRGSGVLGAGNFILAGVALLCVRDFCGPLVRTSSVGLVVAGGWRGVVE